MMTRPLSLALVQAPAAPHHDVGAFAEGLGRLTRSLPGTHLFAYPELHLADAGAEDTSDAAERIEALAQPLDGPLDRQLAEVAGDLGVWLIPGSFYERGQDGRVYNTATAYSPEGRRVASYRKVFPWRPYETVAAGSDFVVFEMTGHGRVGLSICYDAWFPESSRQLAWMGAELIVNVVRTPTADRAQEVTIAKANAIVNQVFVASVNAASPDGLGRSLLVDPQGRARVESSSSESVVLTDTIDLDEVGLVRQYGTAGVTRPWRQFDGDDATIELPLYDGRMSASRWAPRSAMLEEVGA
ncbi:carbon-nitrogen hydrolase family protein [Microbacterium sp. X-17]|uniref:carbon-nitrogen hydrolase family protein n=1 Tax=Microbacterium sp. X-17 TaxID=3144404 RepID=UPI0031F4896A